MHSLQSCDGQEPTAGAGARFVLRLGKGGQKGAGLDVHRVVRDPVVVVPEHLAVVDEGEGMPGRLRVHALAEGVKRLRHREIGVGDDRGRDAVGGDRLAEGTGRVGGDRHELDAVSGHLGSDLLTGKVISSASVYDHKTLLFFSEGVSCQACLEQIQGLQQVGSEMARDGIELVSITPDPPGTLRQAIAAYSITTPVISDTDLSMSQAFNTLGQGMHAETPGHAFALVYHGKVLWYHDYWISNNTMYVQPSTLLAAFAKA